jgi:hypothetical protein
MSPARKRGAAAIAALVGMVVLWGFALVGVAGALQSNCLQSG